MEVGSRSRDHRSLISRFLIFSKKMLSINEALRLLPGKPKNGARLARLWIAESHPTGSTPAVVATILSERILR